MFGHRLAAEFGEAAQGIAVGDAFAQFAILLVLHPPENQGAQPLGGSQSRASAWGLLQAALQITAPLLNDFLLLVEEAGDGRQTRVEENALFPELQISKADLGVRLSAHGSPSSRF